ncbi:MAG: DUF5683 domain-containing protein [candidate division KSB1 bacterium]|nr:DUF5683 domain-containing protein [candidate division KSB1 bacterium]MDZ7368877.1 DUF5683 domain-containing protein [candidate division KSB1 bacterium]MDZ7406865.1 DUF5683 domain-containing protein [candidate division KSB1 bacterium]
MRWLCRCAAVVLFLVLGGFHHSRAQTVAGDSAAVRSTMKKSPRGAMLRSLAVPGWGQYYNRQYFKAALVFGAEAGLVATAIYWNNKANSASDRNSKLFYQNNRNTANWFLLGTILLSMLDAYVDASLSDFDESPDLSLAPAQFANHGIGVRLTIKMGL